MKISIHLMLMLITILPSGVSGIIPHFNTSHVNVNPYENDTERCRRLGFQYISC